MSALKRRAGVMASAAPGQLLVAAVLLASGGAGLAYSNDPGRVLDKVGQAGFMLREVRLEGQEQTSDSAIIAAVGLGPGATLLGLDVDAARSRLEALPWVRTATVRKALPHTLSVTIDEADAFARWRIGGEEVLIARDGDVLSDFVPAEFGGLPLVAGREANEGANSIRGVLTQYPEVDGRIAAAIYVNGRRWDLRFRNGATVRLPAEAPDAALQRLAGLEAEGALLDAGNVVVDMRLSDRTTVSFEAAGAHEDEGERPQLPATVAPADPLAAAIAEATIVHDDPLAKAIAEAFIP
ncbi:MAG: FtsQ-type POTRA domain-containing protein [Pseudomonadota bacterium]